VPALLLLLLLVLGCSGHSARSAPPPCRASQLQVNQGRRAVGLGNLLEELVFTNVGTKPCLLGGYPGITADGRPVPARKGGTYFGRLVPAALQPGSRGYLDFGTADDTDCPIGPSTVHYRDLAFRLPRGGRLRSQVAITEHCSLSISELGRAEPPR
jgi:hypothetical protein